MWVRLAAETDFCYWYEKKIICNWRSSSLSRMTEDRIREILAYYIRCFKSDEFKDLRTETLENIYIFYKLLILHFSRRWQPIKSFKAISESLQIEFFPKLLFYSILSIFGNFPIIVKTKVINPLFRNQSPE